MGRTKVEHEYVIKKKTRKGVCRLIADNKSCMRAVHCRGLCHLHYNRLALIGEVNKYGQKLVFEYFERSNYTINENRRQGKCRVTERGKNCHHKIHGRGLCALHWLKFDRHGVLEKFGTNSRKAAHKFWLKLRIAEDACRMMEDGKGCKNLGNNRGLCSKHYLRFLRDGRLEKFADKRKK